MPRTPSASIERSRRIAAPTLVLAALCTMPCARAGGGYLGIDHQWTYDDSGIWKRQYQTWLINGMIAGEIAGALWEGGEDRAGRTLWQSVDSTLIGAAAEISLKYVFSRERPDQTSDPNTWFSGHGQSFPSGEVTVTAAIVAPLVFEYGKDHPAAYALELIPLYDAIARMKVRGHWASDVIAGYALGTTVGYFMHGRGSPLVLSVMPHAIQIGLKKSF